MDKQSSSGRAVKIAEAKKIIGLKGMAYKDYIAARSLLQGGFLHQAAFFINTCIEKEFKAYLFANDIKVKLQHDTEKLINEVSKIERVDWIDKINLEFIQVINKIYQSRYFEKLDPGYNFVINRNKFLAELDYTYSLLQSKTSLSISEGSFEKSLYQQSVESKNPQVFLNNYILYNKQKAELLNLPDVVYEFRVAESHAIIEMTYTISKNDNHEKFNYEGLKQINDRQFTMSQISTEEN